MGRQRRGDGRGFDGIVLMPSMKERKAIIKISLGRLKRDFFPGKN